MSFWKSLFGKPTQELDDRVRERWGSQPWAGMSVSSEGVTKKDAARRFVKRVQDEARNLQAPIYMTVGESWFQQPSLGRYGRCWIVVNWPDSSDAHRLIPELTSYLRGLCGMTQLSVSEDRNDDFDAVLRHHKDVRVWRINFEKQ